jgi:hypothetical protein
LVDRAPDPATRLAFLFFARDPTPMFIGAPQEGENCCTPCTDWGALTQPE